MSPSSSSVVRCALRSRRRLNVQAAAHYVTFACHSTLVNLSFFIFKIKTIRASIQGLLCTSWRHAQKGSNPRGNNTWCLLVTFKSVTTLSDDIIHLASSLPER